eukprot:TRINITY_DN11448_c0_g1_i1.p1 TRINITY_DN11448_c0_g1~~TRINITY_DN11448_c0_g1_i1.p1  ORF type:complete len:255 (-),score=55.62 TRINITY_DN11448_c0_g1_i1:103-867(-)
MQCYDKKLEATRKQFEREGLKEIDTVLTTTEVHDLLAEMNGCCSQKGTTVTEVDDLEAYLRNQLRKKSNIEIEESKETTSTLKLYLTTPSHATSNGYLQYIMRQAAQEMFGIEDLSRATIKSQIVKNADCEEVELIVDGVTKLCFARMYGLRNINVLSQRMKRGNCRYQYVELMACPSGCLNGGGQLKHENKKPKDLYNEISDFYHNNRDKVIRLPHEDDLAIQLLTEFESELQMLTSYEAVDKTLVNPLKIKW